MSLVHILIDIAQFAMAANVSDAYVFLFCKFLLACLFLFKHSSKTELIGRWFEFLPIFMFDNFVLCIVRLSISLTILICIRFVMPFSVILFMRFIYVANWHSEYCFTWFHAVCCQEVDVLLVPSLHCTGKFIYSAFYPRIDKCMRMRRVRYMQLFHLAYSNFAFEQ